MQDLYKQVFNIAVKELPTLVQTFSNDEKAIFYKGFKVSIVKGEYRWEDTRYNDYYELVDPKITEHIFLNGFIKTLNEVMHHSDLEKVLNIKRQVEKIDVEVSFWTKESTRLWNEFNNKNKKIEIDEIDKGKKITQISTLKRKYERDKNLYQKKRRVLVEEKEEIRKDLIFYEARIKTYNK